MRKFKIKPLQYILFATGLLSGCATPPVRDAGASLSRHGVLMRGEILGFVSMRLVVEKYPAYSVALGRLCHKTHGAANSACEKTSNVPVFAHIVSGRNNPDGKHEWLPIVPVSLHGKLGKRDIVEFIDFEGFSYITNLLVKDTVDNSAAQCRWINEPLSGSYITCQEDAKSGWIRPHPFGLGIPVKPLVVWER